LYAGIIGIDIVAIIRRDIFISIFFTEGEDSIIYISLKRLIWVLLHLEIVVPLTE
jgi:hypothetical protein